MGSLGDWTKTSHAVMIRYPTEGDKLTSRRFAFEVPTGTSVQDFRELLRAVFQTAHAELLALISH
jgi:hypothetical protein